MGKDRKKPAEFDSYAKGYDGGMDDPLKKMMGRSQKDFLAVKANILMDEIAARYGTGRAGREDISILDLGCGTGEFLGLISERGKGFRLEGCDVSPGMIEEGRCRHDTGNAKLFEMDPEGRALPDQRYDVIYASCVFHHIVPVLRQVVVTNIYRALVPGGTFIVFEHNPWNPLTLFVVKRAEIDRNAELLSSVETVSLMKKAGMAHVRTGYFLFVPPRLSGKWTRAFERSISWLPAGAQYYVVGRKQHDRGAHGNI
ncbi:MAG: class I SAM-dependent methyltransferase [Candidatus Omnitrophica bacterium]|nr:class I SAM-dependent methyltransferase [Candidatus Omnitrophota bacterium]MDD5488605.1 class I SAM-dependent methyltransferase [Candidatus Omnitrophota bacterium]